MTEEDLKAYIFPLSMAALVLYKSLKGAAAAGSKTAADVSKAHSKAGFVGALILCAGIYQGASTIGQLQQQPATAGSATLFDQKDLPHGNPTGPGPASGLNLWEININSDEIEAYLKKKYSEAKEAFNDLFDEDKLKEDEELVKEVIEEIGEDFDKMSDKERALLQKFCDKFTRVCKAFDMLDEDLQLKHFDCHSNSTFCEELHTFLRFVAEEYESLKEMSLKDLADKAKKKVCKMFPKLCKKLASACQSHSQLDGLCEEMQQEVQVEYSTGVEEQEAKPKMQAYQQVLSPWDELVQEAKEAEQKRLKAVSGEEEEEEDLATQKQRLRVQLPAMDSMEAKQLMCGAIFVVVVALYMMVFSNYKKAMTKYETLKELSENPKAIVLTPEQANQIFSEHKVEHPLLTGKPAAVEGQKKVCGEQEDAKVFTSAYIKQLIAEREKEQKEEPEYENVSLRISKSNLMA